jgi:hypothetical protein
MSFVFGGVRGHKDPELEDANRRSRLRLARDVNDQETIARDGELPIRRGRPWLWLAVAAVALGVLAVIGGRGGQDVALDANCDTPGVALSAASVVAGDPLGYRLAGPDSVRYVVTLDGTAITGDAGSAVPYTQTAAGPALRLQQCLSPTLETAAPAGDGEHRLAVLAVRDDGGTDQVAVATFTVTGTP